MKTRLKSLIMPEHFSWWRECQPTNFYDSDPELSRSLAFYCRNGERLSEYEGRLSRFGAAAATIINEAAEISNHANNLPTLQIDRTDGKLIEQVCYHPSYHTIGSSLFETGVMQLFSKPANNVVGMAFLHLLSMNGEAGFACPLACTAGIIKAIEALGTAEQKQRYLPRLLDKDYRRLYHGAQYLTESHTGSDVGANRTIAEKDSEHDDVWLITGEKWFCSNVSAHLAVLTARPKDAPEGTRGLGLFLLPQRWPDGSSNGIEIVRLKDKLGTRSLATAEILLKRARAEALGPLDSGFKNMMTYVINTSRLSNCLFASGAARRAFVLADLYVKHRVAFGRQLRDFPLVSQTLSLMKAKSMAILSAGLCLARTLDDLESDETANDTDACLFRLLLNLSKYRSSVLARETVLAGIECLGGNGTIESFSIMPRLLRDCIVYEAWEGPHNVLIAQAYRDLRRDSMLDSAFRYLESVFRLVSASELSAICSSALQRLKALRVQMEKQLAGEETEPSWQFRATVDTFGDLFFLSQMCAEIDWWKRAGLKTDKLNDARAFWFYMHRNEDAAYHFPEFDRLD
jgi:acyl-CoA dehydrogenase